MPQETNLNVTPYNDDYSPDGAYYKVLFKPTNPVQARELNNLQSILQNQIEQFGNHVFKEGSVVIPGNLDFDNNLNAVELQNSYNGVSVSTYIQLLPGKVLKGKTSGVKAKVQFVLTQSESIRGNNTIYVKYISSDAETGTNELFVDGEELIVEESATNTLSTGETVVFTAGQTVAATITSNCTSLACSVSVSDGVYFVRGTFVNVFKHTLLLDQYSNNVYCKVGFTVNERIVTPNDNQTLVDNASGFPNYTAPGADRFSFELLLTKYDLTEENPSSFIQLMEIQEGILISSQDIPQYNILAKELARRTFAESGDYYVIPPSITVNESLNDFLGNNGIYSSSETTYDGNTPNESLGIYKISPISASVQGYSVKTGTSFIDFQKPRTTKLLQNQSINYYTGPTLTLNRVYGTPIVGITSSYTVSLRDSRVGVTQTVAPGKEIGLARVYDFALESGSYSTTNGNLNEWDLALFDVQPYTEILLNQNLDSNIIYNVPCQIVGKSSGASGYLRYDSRNIGILTAYDVKGSFALGERLVFNGIENTRVATAVTSYSLNDAKSVYGIVGAAFTFTADVKQVIGNQIGQVNVSAIDSTSGISTVTLTQTNRTFTGLVNVGNLVAYTIPGISTAAYSRVTKVSSTTLTIAGVTSVSGICDGRLPTTAINPSDFSILSSKFTRSEDNTLYTKLSKENVANVNLTNSNIIIRKQFDVTISANSVGPINADNNETFLPFDEERYALIREDGTTEALSSDKLVFTNGSSTLTINGLGTSSKAKLIATFRRINVKEKVKYKNRVKTIVVDKSKYASSGVGTTSLNDGLSYGNFPYGTRVQDTDICLLSPDVTKIYGVFESTTTSSATLPRLTLSGLSGPTNKTGDLLIGEQLIGSTSKAIAICVEKVDDLTISIVYLGSQSFVSNENIKFQESGITANVVSINVGDPNITSHFTFDDGQKSTIYDYSKLTRLPTFKEPSRKLTVVYESADFLTSDVGDIITANSYSNFDYCDLPKVNGISVADIIDVRPRVTNYTVGSSSRSPFEFLGRDFSNAYLNPKNILASDESINLDYSFYLPRIDKLFLTRDGKVKLVSGSPAESPQPPNSLEDSIEIASVYLPQYLCNVKDAQLTLTTHKRYRMEDIKKLEDRISNLEYYTSLTLLESDTSKLFIPDGMGRNRFKSGFYVDNFSNANIQQRPTTIVNNVDIVNNELRPAAYTTSLDLVIANKAIIGIGTVADTQVDLKFSNDLIGSNIKKTGQLLTLDYDEVEEIKQPYSTRVENVASYRNSFFSGSVSLYPSSDVWADQIKTGSVTVAAKSFTPTEEQLRIARTNQQNGLNTTLWDFVSQIWARGDTLLSSQIITYLRSRNIEFSASRLKPLSRVYAFFDNRGMDRFIVPKLIEIRMVTGTFRVGEVVIGTNQTTNAKIKFRVAKSNHKFGPYDSPTTVFVQNPYNTTSIMPANYSSTTTILNVDTASLAEMTQSGYGGYIDSGMRLKGQTSGAEATVNSDIRLIADAVGDVIGSIFIPVNNPSFETGTRTFRLTSSQTNSLNDGDATSFAQADFYSVGSINRYQENVISTTPRQTTTTTTTTIVPKKPTASTPLSPQVQSIKPWVDGVPTYTTFYTQQGPPRNVGYNPVARQVLNIQALINDINSKNGTSFTGIQISNSWSQTPGYGALDLAVLINRTARRLAGR